MRLADFDYVLPPELIAQSPAEPRDAARLLVLHRADGRREHRIFRDVLSYLRPGDVLVLNDTRVIAARLRARKATGGRAEVLLVRPLGPTRWEALVRPGGRVRAGARLALRGGIVATVGGRTSSGAREVEFSAPVRDVLARIGEVPLPPYITAPLRDPESYQTVYARAPGAVAAPTAGLHFTSDLLERVRQAGVDVALVTLHIGPGTFRPVTADDVREHRMEAEAYRIGAATAAAIRAARARGGRVVVCGTSAVRALESAARTGVAAAEGWTDLFVTPGFRFRITDALITNFHLPRTTVLLLVSAFAGREPILAAYHEAIERRYRFASFGDAMLIV